MEEMIENEEKLSMTESRSRIEIKLEELLSQKNIEEQVNEETLSDLHKAYLTVPNRRMTKTQLREAFEKILKIPITEKNFNVLFKKLDSTRNEAVSWNEFVSYLLLEFRVKGTATLKSQLKDLPLMGLPEMFNSRHHSSVCRITFYPEITSIHDKAMSFTRGCYLTAGRDGTINYWSPDFIHQRRVKTKSPHLRVHSTMITDMIAMPDVQIMCLSSAEYDLRFYDTAANKFDLRIRIYSFEHAIICMDYYFSRNLKDDSCIVLGDTDGSVKVIAFNPIDRGPFKQVPERDTLEIHYASVLKGSIDGMKLREFNGVHSNWVAQVNYYGSLCAFISCSRCSECSLFLSDPAGTKIKYSFSVPLGISCFTLHQEKQLLLTGGPDCFVRIWNPFVSNKANAILRGHRTTICAIVILESGERLFTLSKDRCIKVWDVASQICIQTYNRLPSELSERSSMSVIYNPVMHKLIIASMMIAILVCEKIIDEEVSDGDTHTRRVTCVLYNPLFQLLVTTGADSCIIMWDLWRGRRMDMITDAHSEMYLGEYVQVEITAAAFDYTNQFLITGGRDGSLKIWSIISSTCIRSILVEKQRYHKFIELFN